jgi:LacI family transcriptional regulator
MEAGSKRARKATASDVARAAGVSKWTVTRAFTPGASIAEDSRKRVLEAAERLSYRPNLLARSLATKSTQQVAVLVDDFANLHKLPFLEKLTAALQADGMVAMLINPDKGFSRD